MKKIAKKWISCMITAAMVVGGLTLSPITTMEVQAAPAETRNVNLRLTDNSIAGISGDTVNTANAATVYYGKYPEVEGVEETLKGTSMPWRVIGYNGTGVASSSNSGKATLLAADRVINKVQFLAGGSSNQYSGSTLKDKIEIIAGGLATIEKEAVSARTLAICGYNQEDHVNGEGHDGYCDGITGSKVADAVMWPLSTREAQNLNASLWTITASAQRTFWWLRSPGTYEKCAAGVDSDGYVASPVDIGADEYYHGSARPAFNLKLSSVLFTSESGASNCNRNRRSGYLSYHHNCCITDQWRNSLRWRTGGRWRQCNSDSKSKQWIQICPMDIEWQSGQYLIKLFHFKYYSECNLYSRV